MEWEVIGSLDMLRLPMAMNRKDDGGTDGHLLVVGESGVGCTNGERAPIYCCV